MSKLQTIKFPLQNRSHLLTSRFADGKYRQAIVPLRKFCRFFTQEVIGSGLGKFENKPKTTWSRFPVSVINFFVYKTDKIDICTFPYCKYSSLCLVVSGCASVFVRFENMDSSSNPRKKKSTMFL